MVQPWVPPSVLSLPICSWKSLNLKPLALPLTPCLWLRFVDDTLVILNAEHSNHMLQYINSQDPNIQFTVEEPGTYGSIPFLDTKVTPGPNNTIHTTVYRKPTHTDQYLHWDSNHFISAKHSVYNVYKTLPHRAKVVSSTQTDLSKEMYHIGRALQSCLLPIWALNRLQHHFKHNNRDPNPTDSQDSNNHNSNDTTNHNRHRNISMVVPYIQGLEEMFKGTFNKHGIQVYFKGTNTIRLLFMAPKDKDIRKVGLFISTSVHISNVQKNTLVNLAAHLGTDSRNISKHHHPFINTPAPQETQLTRNIKEAIFIRVNDPSLNRNLG